MIKQPLLVENIEKEDCNSKGCQVCCIILTIVCFFCALTFLAAILL